MRSAVGRPRGGGPWRRPPGTSCCHPTSPRRNNQVLKAGPRVTAAMGLFGPTQFEHAMKEPSPTTFSTTVLTPKPPILKEPFIGISQMPQWLAEVILWPQVPTPVFAPCLSDLLCFLMCSGFQFTTQSIQVVSICFHDLLEDWVESRGLDSGDSGGFGSLVIVVLLGGPGNLPAPLRTHHILPIFPEEPIGRREMVHTHLLPHESRGTVFKKGPIQARPSNRFGEGWST